MKTSLFFLLFFPLVFLFSPPSAGQSGDNFRNIPVESFDKVIIEGNFKVFLYQSDQPYLKVVAPSDDMVDALDIRTPGTTLSIGVRKMNFTLTRVELHIGYKELHSMHIKGGVKLVTDGYVEVDDFDILVEGSGSVDMKMKANSIDVTSHGGSVFDLEGITESLTVKVAGAGHVNAREMTAKEVIFRVEGVGFGSVYATDLLDVKIEGVGKVTYKGTPTVRRIIEGLGKVEEY